MTSKLVAFVQPGPGNERLDKALVAHLPDYSRSRLQALIKDGRVTVAGNIVLKTGLVVEAGQQVQVEIPPIEPTDLQPEAIPLDVVFENVDLMVINKPAGMVVHPAAGHDTGTLVHAVLGYDPDIEGIGGEERPGVVHRLDKDTSGLILLARNDRAHHWLQDQFRLRKVEKTYLALVDGAPPTPSGRVETAIGRDPAHRKKMAILPPGRGRESVSEYRTREKFTRHTLLEFHPLTGRTHQVRLHCAFLGSPIVGDRIYGRHTPTLLIQRHFLHAAQLKIILPGEEQPHIFEAPLPLDLTHVLELARKEN